ncbi:MAG: PAS domain S-box protein [Candidatus Brocadiia bacterium]
MNILEVVAPLRALRPEVLLLPCLLAAAGGAGLALIWRRRHARSLREQLRAAEALRDSEQRYRALYDNIGVGVSLISPDMRVLALNRCMKEWFPTIVPSERPLCYQAFNCPPRTEPCGYCPTKKTLVDGQVHEDVASTPTAEGVRYYRIVSTPLTDPAGRIIAAIEMVDDITERKRAEEALRESEERFRTLFCEAPIGVAIDGPDGRFMDANDAYCSILGYSKEELLRMKVLAVLHPDDREAFLNAATNLVSGASSGYSAERRYVRKDGSELFGRITTRAVRGADGKFRYRIAMFEDITGRKRAEADRAALDEQLRQAQKMESVGRLAGGVAHDFNNILTGISGYTELALEQADAASPLHEDLAEVLRLSKRAAELTRQLLAFSRRQTLEPKVLNINDMIADTAKMLKRVLGEDVDLHFAPAPDLGNVRADVIQIEQVLMNLAINARDAMPDGGKLTIETANVELDAAYAAGHVSSVPGRYVLMAVSDTGHGMDAATQSHLFEPFFTTKDKSKGTGLGLATAYGIVKQHGGNIWVYSEAGKGATFKVYLPMVAEAAGAANPAAEAGVRSGDETILIVEDEPTVRAIATRALKARGYVALTAGSAEEAEGLFSEHAERISLLLTDVVLPGINGPGLYERLRRRLPGLKVLYMSGHAGNAAVHQGVLDAGVAFMQKPFTLETIARKVRQVLGG